MVNDNEGNSICYIDDTTKTIVGGKTKPIKKETKATTETKKATKKETKPIKKETKETKKLTTSTDIVSISFDPILIIILFKSLIIIFYSLYEKYNSCLIDFDLLLESIYISTDKVDDFFTIYNVKYKIELEKTIKILPKCISFNTTTENIEETFYKLTKHFINLNFNLNTLFKSLYNGKLNEEYYISNVTKGFNMFKPLLSNNTLNQISIIKGGMYDTDRAIHMLMGGYDNKPYEKRDNRDNRNKDNNDYKKYSDKPKYVSNNPLEILISKTPATSSTFTSISDRMGLRIIIRNVILQTTDFEITDLEKKILSANSAINVIKHNPFHDEELVNYMYYGCVYNKFTRMKLNVYDVTFKIYKIESVDSKLLFANIYSGITVMDSSLYLVNSTPLFRELSYYNKIMKLTSSYKMNNFCLMYSVQQINNLNFRYRSLIFHNNETVNDDIALLMVCESPDMSFSDWIDNKFENFNNVKMQVKIGMKPYDIWINVIFQIICVFYSLNSNEMSFPFMSLDNFCIKFTPSTQTKYYKYVIDNIPYYLPNIGILIMFDSKFKYGSNREVRHHYCSKDYQDTSMIEDNTKNFIKIMNTLKSRTDTTQLIVVNKFITKIIASFNQPNTDQVFYDIVENDAQFMRLSEQFNNVLLENYTNFLSQRIGTLLYKHEQNELITLEKYDQNKSTTGSMGAYVNEYNQLIVILYVNNGFIAETKTVQPLTNNMYITTSASRLYDYNISTMSIIDTGTNEIETIYL